MTALTAAALTVFGVLSSVYVFAGDATYRDLMRGTASTTLRLDGFTWTFDEPILVEIHRGTLAYVLGEAPEPPRGPNELHIFDAAERSHLADVRGVFRGVQIAWSIGALGLAALLVRGRIRGYLASLVRGAAIASGAVVLLVAVFAAVAFGPAFLLFHQVFFPQGNFLFDPATSNLLRVYPEQYWYGVTLRVFGTFLVACALLAGIATWSLRTRGGR